MSEFQKSVYTALERVPRGSTVTYPQLAELAGQPSRAARYSCLQVHLRLEHCFHHCITLSLSFPRLQRRRHGVVAQPGAVAHSVPPRAAHVGGAHWRQRRRRVHRQVLPGPSEPRQALSVGTRAPPPQVNFPDDLR